MFENPRRGSQARNFTTNVSKILDLKLSSEQNFSENWRWVPPVRDCDGRNICLLVLSSKLTLHHGIKGRASPTSTKVSIFAWDCVQMNFFAWFSCLFFWPNVGHAPKLCVYITSRSADWALGLSHASLGLNLAGNWAATAACWRAKLFDEWTSRSKMSGIYFQSAIPLRPLE